LAIRADRGGQRRPGAGFLRLAGRKKKAALLAGVPILLILLILTFDKSVFLFRLAGAALRSGKGGRDYLTAMADCAYRRPRLLPLLADESGNPEFLATWIASHLRRGEGQIRNKDTAPFLERVTARFPENILLDSLGFYEKRTGSRDWGNFDPLFFRLAGDPDVNAVSYRALTGAFQDGRLQADALPPLLSYLAWMNNPALAGDLRDWAAGAGLPGEVLAGSAGALSSLAPAARINPEAVRKALSEVLHVEAAELELGKDMMDAAKSFEPGAYDEPWEFVDMSRREPFATGSFAGGADAGAGPALRVMGFFVKNEPGRIPCRAGFSRKPAIPLGAKTYLFHFFYRTLGAGERPSFWLAAPEFIPERELGPTQGEWRRVLYVFRNGELGIPESQPQLRMWGTGTVWFAGIGLCELGIRALNLPSAKEALFYE